MIIGLGGFFITRFLLRGDEDAWICVNNEWTRHGNPGTSKPLTGCGEVKDTRQTQTIDEIGLSFKYPADTTFRKEIAKDSAGIRTVGFYVEKGDKDKPTYMLYGVYEANKVATKQDLEKGKMGMDSTTIKEVTIGGIQGIEGLVLGQKTRYMTVLLVNDRILTLSTIPPTVENKTITDSILSTLIFK